MKRLLLLLATGAALPSAEAQAEPIREPPVYRQCAACHSKASGALGPDLERIVGRPAASASAFRYSGPLKRSGIVWTRERLRAFLIDPQAVVPGNRMPFSGVSPSEAAIIVDYLAKRRK